MDGDTGERGTGWLGYALQEGIKHGLTDAREMLAHATPEVLVAQLPKDLTTQLISGALKTGRLTPESVLEGAPPTGRTSPPLAARRRRRASAGWATSSAAPSPTGSPAPRRWSSTSRRTS